MGVLQGETAQSEALARPDVADVDRVIQRFAPRPLAEWESAVEVDEHLLRDLIYHLRDGGRPKELRGKALMQAIEVAEGDIKQMFRADDPKPLSSSRRAALLLYILEAYPRLKREDPDSQDTADPAILMGVVRGMTRFLRVGLSTRDHTATRLSGIYWVYRRSVVDPSKYLKGLLSMWWIPGSDDDEEGDGMVRVCEVHRARQEIKGHHCEAPELSETYDGFALIKKNTLFLFLAERYSRNDRGPLLIARFHHFVPSEQSLPMLVARGWLPGAGESGLALPIVLVRTQTEHEPRALLDYTKGWPRQRGDACTKGVPPSLMPIDEMYQACNIVDEEHVPSMVLAQLGVMARDNEARR